MPRTQPPVPGVEFLQTSVSNGDGTTLQVFVTTQANGRFSGRAVNGCPRPCIITLQRQGFPPEDPIIVPSGTTTFSGGNRLYSEWGNIEIQSAPRE